MVTRKAATIQMQHPDETILGDIWQSLWKMETIRSIDIHDISVDVENGQVCLSGHVSRGSNQQQIEEIARTIPGVIAVHNHLVTDRDLSLQVAQVLGEDERTCNLNLTIYSCHGWVELGGIVPNRDVQCIVEEAAASVPAVRGVILLPDIEGDHTSPLRDALQPRIGVQVYGANETEGKVHQVVILPQNRLVTHAIVRVSQHIDGWQRSCDYLVPVKSMRVVDDGGILLNSSAPAIDQFPVFNPVDYPFAPLTWQPPYPYAAGNVRWPRQEQEKGKQHIEVNVGKAEKDYEFSQS
jgi:hypothetical protein